MTAVLDRITIYPIKSLDGVSVEEAAVLPSGALENDRRFALVDAEGRHVNGKRTAAVHGIRAKYDLARMTVRFNGEAEFSLPDDQREIGNWLSDALGIACGLTENPTAGFPDDTDAPGPTLVSTATLEEVSRWFPGLTLDETRRRFRANLELAGVVPFWEDRLVGPTGVNVPFQIGAVRWHGVNPCQRCVVPTRDSEAGAVMSGFQKTFAVARESASALLGSARKIQSLLPFGGEYTARCWPIGGAASRRGFRRYRIVGIDAGRTIDLFAGEATFCRQFAAPWPRCVT